MQFGHVERKEDADWVKRRTSVIVGGFTPNAQDVAELQAGKMQMLGVVTSIVQRPTLRVSQFIYKKTKL